MKKQIKKMLIKLIGQAVALAFISLSGGYFCYWAFLQNTIY